MIRWTTADEDLSTVSTAQGMVGCPSDFAPRKSRTLGFCL
jgi:hypothetical protein